jgi:hypothetical protein
MARVNSHHSIPDSSRRRFLTVAAGASAVSATAMAAATMPVRQACTLALLDDGELLKLEEQIFELHEQATSYDAEIIRLSEIWTTESERLYKEALSREVQTGTYLTPEERWALVTDMPECVEHDRLCRLQDPLYRKMKALVKRMFAIPAQTAEGRRAQATVLLGCVLGDDWRRCDDETEYPERMARRLLIEFVGGEPGDQLREQFS